MHRLGARSRLASGFSVIPAVRSTKRAPAKTPAPGGEALGHPARWSVRTPNSQRPDHGRKRIRRHLDRVRSMRASDSASNGIPRPPTTRVPSRAPSTSPLVDPDREVRLHGRVAPRCRAASRTRASRRHLAPTRDGRQTSVARYRTLYHTVERRRDPEVAP